MKKFFTGLFLVAILFFAGIYGYFMEGLYLDNGDGQPVVVSFKTKEKEYYFLGDEGYEPLEIRGIHVAQARAFESPMDFQIDEETYYRWFQEIQAVGANTVKINMVYNDDFYNALHRFNEDHEEPLYLLQGIRVEEDAVEKQRDAFSPEFREALLKEGKKAVDVVHGRRILLNEKTSGNGFYFKDLSPYVLGFIVGDDWHPDFVAYTNLLYNDGMDYQGEFLYTNGANAFETVLAEVLDTMVHYETRKYGAQRPVSFFNTSLMDPFEYEESYAALTGKFNRIDMENIYDTEAFLAGHFAAYQYTETTVDLLENLAPNGQNQALLSREEVTNYLTLLEQHHEVPLVMVHVNVASVRASSSAMERIEEQDQGEKMVSILEELKSANIAHGILSSWQDQWYLRNWTTAYATDDEAAYLWQDAQTETQHYGLMAFDVHRDEGVMRVDGKEEDWAGVEQVEANGWILQSTFDHNHMYILVRHPDIKEQELIIGLDFLMGQGATSSIEPKATFSRPVDFLLYIHGEEKGEFRVHERYHSLRPNFLERLRGVNPYVLFPAKNSRKFVVPEMIRRRIPHDLDLEENAVLWNYETYKTGTLFHGVGNPLDPNYSSLTDYSFGEDFVEIKIPYYLLNFYNPVERSIHEDYYEHYGVEPRQIRSYHIGVGGGEEMIQLHEKNFPSLPRVGSYEERHKKAYKILQAYWRD